jgi:hypothetical protein
MFVRFAAVQMVAYDGDLDGAELGYLRVAEFGRDIGSADVEQWGAVGVYNVDALRGRRPELADLVTTQADLTPGSQGWRIGAVRALALAGRADEASRMLREHHLDRPASFPSNQFTLCCWAQLGIVAAWLDDAALGAQVEAVLRPFRDVWSHHLVFLDGPVTWFLGAALAAQGRVSEAVELFEQADQTLADAGLDPFRAVVALDLVRALALSDDPAHRARAREVGARESAAATARGLDQHAARFDMVLSQAASP